MAPDQLDVGFVRRRTNKLACVVTVGSTGASKFVRIGTVKKPKHSRLLETCFVTTKIKPNYRRALRQTFEGIKTPNARRRWILDTHNQAFPQGELDEIGRSIRQHSAGHD